MAPLSILHRAGREYVRLFHELALLAIVASLVLAFFRYVFDVLTAELLDSEVAVFSAASALSGAFVTLVGSYWLQSALILSVVALRRGTRLTTDQLFAGIATHLPSVILTGVLAGIGVWLGLALLVIPGLVLATYWFVVVPVAAIEGRAVLDSIARSAQLVRGSPWPTAWVMVGSWVAARLMRWVVSTPLLMVAKEPLAVGVADMFVAPFVAIVVTLAYEELLALEAHASVA